MRLGKRDSNIGLRTTIPVDQGSQFTSDGSNPP
jgi:hypothetical protein